MNLNKDIKENINNAKNLSLKGIFPQCRSIANNFFNCIENNLIPFNKDGKNYSYEELEKDLNERVIPMCMKQYDLNSCLNLYKNFNNNIYNILDDEVKL